ncbi:MAG: transcription elongation factor GreA [Candidatus Woesebacteria bacterium]|jgi:transcription elongation factor GreA
MTGNNQIPITKEGLKALENELEILLEEKRPQLVDRLSNARQQGDLSENSDYQNAKDELEFMDGQIDELNHVIKNASIIKKSRGDTVTIGAKVKVKGNGLKQSFHIVGEWEADPKEKKISHSSPLGQALVGKKKGEKVEVEAPAGKITYEILSVD